MRALRILGRIAGALVLLAVLAVAGVLVGLNVDAGRRLVEREVARATGGQVVLAGLGGTFPTSLRIGRLEVHDAGGEWLVVEDAALDWSPMRLLAREARVDALSAARIALARLPAASGSSSAPSNGTNELPVRVNIEWLHVGRLELGAPVAGAAAVVSVDGSARLASLEAGEARLALDRLDGPGSYRLDGTIGPASLSAHLQASEPARGLVSQVAGLPDVGAIAATASLEGPWNAAALHFVISAGPLHASIGGTLDLKGMAGDLEVAANAPAMRPRPDLAWQGITVQAQVRGPLTAPEAGGTIELTGLETGDAGLDRLTVHASGHTGAATVDATAEGVRLPGPRPDLLAAAPLHLTAQARLDAPDRPVVFSLSHPLASIEGTAHTAGPLSGEARIMLPDLAPLAVAGGVDLQGRTALTAKATQDAAGTHVDLDGTLGVTGGMAPVPALLGPEATLGLSALLHGADVTFSRLRVAGRTLTLGAEGGLRGGEISLDWRVGLADLGVLAATVQGNLDASGHVAGRTDALAVNADLSGNLATSGFPSSPVHGLVLARGLPGNPAGSISAEGTLDGQPLALAAEATRAGDGALHAHITRADWRSTHAEGELDLPQGAALPLGTMTLKVGDLSDFSRFVGQRLVGSIEAGLRTEQQDGVPVAVLDLSARNAGLPGRASVGAAKLTARLRDPVGEKAAEARLEVTGLRAGAIGGGLRLDVSGKPDALSLGLVADLTGVGGADLSAKAAATLDTPARTLAVSSLQAGWKGEMLRLLAPARLSFADGVTVDRARLGLRGAVLEVAGRASPTLDLIASLRNVTADLARIAAPDLQADGRLEADAKLGGTPARPTGTLRLAATGLHMRTGAAAGLPAASLTVDATLRGESARLDANATAGRNRLALAGTAPLAAGGAMDLRATGNVDLASFNPILAANGRRLRGQLTLDATIGGTVAAPRADGSARLAGGEVQDFALGARLDDIEAVVQANGDTVRIARFTARAGKGSISASGTVGLAAPMPVELSLTARNASPLASDKLTAVLGADLTLRGEAAGRLNLAGTMAISQADIRIPETLPTRLAVLEVRRPGQKPPPLPSPGPDIGLDVTLNAPSRIFVRGRGLDAELAGNLHLGGSAATPQPRGSFTLRRGQFALAGSTLDFTKGEVGFDGSGKIDPTLDFLASSNNGTVIANLAVKGYASAPKITLSSTPELPQDEVLAWLLFHQSVRTLSPLQLAQIAQAVAQMSGGGGGFDPLGRLRSGLGLDRLSVGSGQGGKGTAVEAGRYLAQGVYVGAKQGTNGTGTQATVQVDLAKGLKLETTVGQSQGATGASTSGQDSGTSVGLTYQFEY